MDWWGALDRGGARTYTSLVSRKIIGAVVLAAAFAVVPTGWALYGRSQPPPTPAGRPPGAPAAVLAIRDEPAPSRRVEPPRPALPVRSRPEGARPMGPTAIPAAAAEKSFEEKIEAALAGMDTCLVVADGGHHQVVSRYPDRPLIPASTQKLLVAAAALSRLGPGFRYQTDVIAPQAPRDGEVGELWVLGGGDPVLATAEYAAHLASRARTAGIPTTSLEALADALVAQGIRAVRGPIHGDDTRYEATRYLPTWKESYRTRRDVAPLSALTINGGWRTWTPRTQPPDDPAAHVASELARLLRLRGVIIDGPADRSAAPPEASILARVTSPPLAGIIAGMLRSSDNLTAELLTRELGRQMAGEATTAAGAGMVIREVSRLGVGVEGLRLVDGSGLDTGNRATCGQLAAALDLGARPRLGALWEGLAVAGRSGTLARSMVGTPFEGRLRAKTGSIEGVSGLVGFLEGGRTLRFALLVNGAFSSGRPVQERILKILADHAASSP
ncbi:MAG: D-alanyl-D-alanine carboxypeptidase/D-alanyl-D-alanine endopeptidase [Actinomycetota bacterium]